MADARQDPNLLAVPSSVNLDVPPPDLSQRRSAPPILCLDSSSLFAFHQSQKEADIRANEEYYKFYQMYNNTHRLPAPLETPFYKGDFERKVGPFTLPEEQIGDGRKPFSPATPTSTSVWAPLKQVPLDKSGPHDEYDMGERRGSLTSMASSPGMPPQFDPSFLHDSSPQLQPSKASHGTVEGGSGPGFPPAHYPPYPRGEGGYPRQRMGYPPDPRSVTNAYLVQGVCRFFLSGQCSRGSACPHPHGDPFGTPSVGLGVNRGAPAEPYVYPMDPNEPASADLPIDADRKQARSRSMQYGGYAGGRPHMPSAMRPGRGGFQQPQAQVAPLLVPPAPQFPGGAPGAPGAPPGPPGAPGAPPGASGGRSPRGGMPHSPAKTPPADPMRYSSMDQVVGQILNLCKDQHGCRFLQKKLDERAEDVVTQIFEEVHGFMPELMIDPFGNYLCQKLFECCDDYQRLKILENVSADLVNISLNMHGTRAVQKMVEFLSTVEQVELLTQSLRGSVVLLIKDLNGNHVVQRCLSKLSADENQFIYDAVVENCIEVATHRHGCCVLQRCLDHASDQQRVQLVDEITHQAMSLVQDAFGNYVVQYVLDLNVVAFSDALANQFLGHVIDLAVQKFSSNVVEKCLKLSGPVMRGAIVLELTESERLSRLLSDPFGNYVVQTALSVAPPSLHAGLIQKIKPHTALLRNTPYGKRILHKIQRESPGSPAGGKRGPRDR